MVNRPSVPEIITVNSETLQTQIRDLLPSQNGFGSELQASNVITPIIDLTAAAEGNGLPFDLQEAKAFDSQTSFSQVGAGTTTIANSTGFYRVIATANIDTANANHTVELEMTDGSTTKIVWQMGNLLNTSTGTSMSVNVDLIFFLAAGESLQVTCSTGSYTAMSGSVRQVATGSGTLVQPNGYPL